MSTTAAKPAGAGSEPGAAGQTTAGKRQLSAGRRTGKAGKVRRLTRRDKLVLGIMVGVPTLIQLLLV